jgi:hypothetical protein
MQDLFLIMDNVTQLAEMDFTKINYQVGMGEFAHLVQIIV